MTDENWQRCQDIAGRLDIEAIREIFTTEISRPSANGSMTISHMLVKIVNHGSGVRAAICRRLGISPEMTINQFRLQAISQSVCRHFEEAKKAHE
jgi:hypothetical protein